MLDAFLLALRELFSNLLRSILSMLGIAVGIVALISMMSLNEGTKKQIIDEITRIGGADIIRISPSNKNRYNIDYMTGNSQYKYPISYGLFLKLVKKFPDIGTIPIAYVSSPLRLPVTGYATYSPVGVTPEYFNIFNTKVIEGRLITDLDVAINKQVIVIPNELRKAVFEDKPAIGQLLQISNYSFEVVGVVESKYDIFIPVTTAINKVNSNPYIGRIIVKTGDVEMIEEIVPEIKSFLERITEHGDMFDLFIQKDRIDSIYETKSFFSRLMLTITLVGLFVGGVGIMNIMMASLKDRIREIGVKKSVGAKNHQIFVQFLIESMSLCIIGGIVGILFGIWSSDMLTNYLIHDPALKRIKAILSIDSILIAFIYSALVGIIFGIYPAIKAAKINPINALRYE